jgi:hypothetical protein
MANGTKVQSGGSANDLYALVGCYSVLVFVVVTIANYFVGRAADFFSMLSIIAIICVLVGGIGILLAYIAEELGSLRGPFSPTTFPPPPSFSPPPRFPWLFYAICLVVCVTIIVGGSFYYAHTHKEPNHVLVAGVASALAWGLSVVGALIWSSLGIVSSIYWNGWFNLFAAAFAALAVGYS